jgi:alkylated DNA repair dioxygenase AlkB
MWAPGRLAYGPDGRAGNPRTARDPALPNGFSLESSFLPEDEAERSLCTLSADTPWETHHFRIFGRTVPMPRRIAWYGAHTYGYSGIVHPARPMPAVVAGLRDRVTAACGHPFNCVLLNLYRDGRDSMGWHADDDYDAGPHTGVASLSLGAARRFRLRSRDAQRRSLGLDLGPGSLLFMGPGTQSAWQHALPRTARAVGPRLNLTFRHLVADDVRT